MGGKAKSFLMFFYPGIAKMFPNWSGWNNLLKLLEPRQKFFHETIEEHKETFQEDYARDFIDVYLKEVQKTTDATSSFHESNAGGELLNPNKTLFTNYWDASLYCTSLVRLS